MEHWDLEAWLEALCHGRPTPAGGSLALVTLAGAAALASKIAAIAGRSAREFERAARVFLEGAWRDAALYPPDHASDATVRESLEAEAMHLEQGAAFLEALGELFGDLPEALQADVAAGARLSDAACRTLLTNLALNVQRWGGRVAGLDEVAKRMRRVQGRLGSA